MGEFSEEELREALRAVESMVGKIEKAQAKLKPGTSQHTLTINRLKALGIAAALMNEALDRQDS